MLKGDLNSNSGDTRTYFEKPSVLMPVFEYKKRIRNQGKDTENMDYKSWLKNELKINFKDGSSVLSTTYFNSDKEIIKF